MSKKCKYVFQERLSSEDESSGDSEDEIEIIPYVKPAPVVIDLVESEGETDGRERKKKKKSKKRKSRKDKEGGSTLDCASQEGLVNASFDSSHSTGTNQKESGDPLASSDCGGKEPTSDRNEGHQMVTSSTASSSAGQVQSDGPLTAVVSKGSTSTTCNLDNNSNTVLPQVPANLLAGKGTLGSNFDKCKNAQSNKVATKPATAKKTGAEMVGTPPSCPSPPGRKTPASPEKRKPRSTGKAQGVTRPRTRKVSATKRTDEEIYHFLSTLGIDLHDPNPRPPEPPATRTRIASKRPANDATSASGNDASTAIPTISIASSDKQVVDTDTIKVNKSRSKESTSEEPSKNPALGEDPNQSLAEPMTTKKRRAEQRPARSTGSNNVNDGPVVANVTISTANDKENVGSNKVHRSRWDQTPSYEASKNSSMTDNSFLATTPASSSISSSVIPVQVTISPPNWDDGAFPNTWTESMKEFYGATKSKDFEHMDVWQRQPESSRLWGAPSDMMPPPSRNKRNYMRCDRCKQFGHFARECREKIKPLVCSMCGEEGHTSTPHSRVACRHAACLNCGRKLHHFAQKCPHCLLRRDPKRCKICHVIGHDHEVCPDTWRRFHQTTSNEEFEKITEQMGSNSKGHHNHHSTSRGCSSEYKSFSLLFCSNCGRKGHHYYDCKSSRFSPYHRNKPYVVYEVPLIQNTEKHPASASSSEPIPISYDPSTGRTVVISTENENVPEIAVETIQVQISNDLAKVSGAPATCIPCKTSPGCRNKLVDQERCLQVILQTQAHAKLARAEKNGLLSNFEKKHNVQISVISEGYKIHIAGHNAMVAEKDLYRFLWDEVDNQQKRASSQDGKKDEPNNVGKDKESVIAGSSNINKVTGLTTVPVEDPSNIENTEDIPLAQRLQERRGRERKEKTAKESGPITTPSQESPERLPETFAGLADKPSSLVTVCGENYVKNQNAESQGRNHPTTLAVEQERDKSDISGTTPLAKEVVGPTPAPVFTLDDDDLVVIAEIPKHVSDAFSNKSNTFKETSFPTEEQMRDVRKNPVNNFASDLPCPGMYTNFEAPPPPPAWQNFENTPSSSFLPYESPLAGLPLYTGQPQNIPPLMDLNLPPVPPPPFVNPMFNMPRPFIPQNVPPNPFMNTNLVNPDLFGVNRGDGLVPHPFAFRGPPPRCFPRMHVPFSHGHRPPPPLPIFRPPMAPMPVPPPSLPVSMPLPLVGSSASPIPLVTSTQQFNNIPAPAAATTTTKTTTTKVITVQEEVKEVSTIIGIEVVDSEDSDSEESDGVSPVSKPPAILSLLPSTSDKENERVEGGNMSEGLEARRVSAEDIPEVITIDDDDEEEDHAEFMRKIREMEEDRRYKVTLLKSEWQLVTNESMRSGNALNEISEHFNVELEMFKEASSIIVKNGSHRKRKMAKDNIVHWLECQSADSPFALLPRGRNDRFNNSGGSNRSRNRATRKARKEKIRRKKQRALRASKNVSISGGSDAGSRLDTSVMSVASENPGVANTSRSRRKEDTPKKKNNQKKGKNNNMNNSNNKHVSSEATPSPVSRPPPTKRARYFEQID